MPTGETLQGNLFEYAGSLETGLVISFSHTAIKISPEIIKVIRNESRKGVLF